MSTRPSLNTFSKLKSDLHFEVARLGQTTRDNATGVSTTRMNLPSQVPNYINVKIEELDLFAQEMFQLLADYAEFAYDVAQRFHEVTRSFLDGPIPSFDPIGAILAKSPE